MTLATRRALCAVMVFAVVEKAGTVVMKDEEELDSWSVILNGHVQVNRPSGDIEHLHMGDRSVRRRMSSSHCCDVTVTLNLLSVKIDVLFSMRNA